MDMELDEVPEDLRVCGVVELEFSSLPQEVQLLVFMQLSISDIGRITSVCSIWHDLLESDFFWRSLYDKYYGVQICTIVKKKDGHDGGRELYSTRSWKLCCIHTNLDEFNYFIKPRDPNLCPKPREFVPKTLSSDHLEELRHVLANNGLDPQNIEMYISLATNLIQQRQLDGEFFDDDDDDDVDETEANEDEEGKKKEKTENEPDKQVDPEEAQKKKEYIEKQMEKFVWATLFGHWRIMEQIIADCGSGILTLSPKAAKSLKDREWVHQDLIESIFSYNDSLLHIASCYGHIEAVQVLVDAGVKIDALPKDKETAFYWAARYGFIEILEILLKAGAFIDCPNNSGGTPLERAIREGQYETAMWLLGKGADVKRKKFEIQSVFWWIGTSEGLTEKEKIALMEKVRENEEVRDWVKDGALVTAAVRHRDVGLVHYLVGCGADVEDAKEYLSQKNVGSDSKLQDLKQFLLGEDPTSSDSSSVTSTIFSFFTTPFSN
eukprot:TRINITY_DN4721_c0_g1_i2.p1 TRINITY_DN4721_c0_g1~~TRINITY_DN4721_c0_g1_i2.p1  ORF type:complete len:493 (-),score=103.71 TRINITY_DN4721_c0_g1_i2:75-1553(-)